MNKIKIKIDNFDKIKSFAEKVIKFDSDINLKKGNRIIDAKSILSIIALIDLRDIIELEIISSDENEIKDFINTMKEFEV